MTVRPTETPWAMLAAAREFERKQHVESEVLARALFVAMIGFLVAGLFISSNYSKLLWLLLALGPATLAVARRVPSPTSSA